MIMAIWIFISVIVLSIGVLLSLAEFSCTEMDGVEENVPPVLHV